MYKVDFSLSEWNFTVYFNTLEDYLFYKRQIETSVVDMKHKDSKNETIKIYYQNDKDLYNSLLSTIKKRDKKTISSFQDEYYDLYGDTYVSSKERYLIRNEGNNTYRMICNGFLKRHEVIYLIREIYVRLQENKKSLFMHGNGIEMDNKGIMLLGNSGSGKTTFMMKLLDTDDDTSYLSNDRVFLRRDRRIDYFPIPLILANGTAQNNRRLFDYLSKRDSLYDSTYRRDTLLHGEVDDKYALFRNHFFEIFPNCKNVESTNLDYVILPKINLNGDRVEIREIDDKSRILDTCFTPVDHESKRRPWILKRDLTDQELYANREQIISDLVDRGQIYECLYHPDITPQELQEKVKTKVLKRDG